MSRGHESRTALARVCGHSFLPGLFPSQPAIVDLGANHGEFSGAMARQYRAHGLAVEPNPTLEVAVDGFTVVKAAVAAADGPVELTVSGNDQASTIMGGPGGPAGGAGAGGGAAAGSGGGTAVRHDVVQGATLATLLDGSGLDHVDLLKMDIEGMEIMALGGLSSDRLARIDQITVEYHDSQRLTDPAEIVATTRRLAAAGFMAVRMSVMHQGDVLYVRRALLSPAEQLRVAWVDRPWRLFLRAAQRARQRLAGRSGRGRGGARGGGG